MKKSTTYIAGTLMAATVIVTGASLHAQNSSSKSDDSSNITVTGCLQAAGSDRSAVGTSGSATSGTAAARSGSTAGDNQSFMLVNARVGGAPGGGSGVTSVAPPGSGTTESAARAGSTAPSPALSGATDRNGNSTASGAMYVLRSENPELPRHVGQEVEVSGRLITGASTPSASTPSSAAGTPNTASSSSSASNGSADRTPQLDVRTIRMIASVCAAR